MRDKVRQKGAINTTAIVQMTDVDRLEFAIFHWVSRTMTSLPGLTETGSPSPDFFLGGR